MFVDASDELLCIGFAVVLSNRGYVTFVLYCSDDGVQPTSRSHRSRVSFEEVLLLWSLVLGIGWLLAKPLKNCVHVVTLGTELASEKIGSSRYSIRNSRQSSNSEYRLST